MTDELASYTKLGKEFAGHTTVNHSADEYVRLGGFGHVNTAECRFSLMKRAVFGTHHSISEAHLPRYLAEWDFKWNTRKVKDGERAALIAKGIDGKRLTYRPAHQGKNHKTEGKTIYRLAQTEEAFDFEIFLVFFPLGLTFISECGFGGVLSNRRAIMSVGSSNESFLAMASPEIVKTDMPFPVFAMEADTDYLLARLINFLGGSFHSRAGFFAQQACEKYMKALSVQRDGSYAETHKLLDLATICEPYGTFFSETETKRILEQFDIFDQIGRYGG
jgi:ISXO2-like transposase domain/HEPN domain